MIWGGARGGHPGALVALLLSALFLLSQVCLVNTFSCYNQRVGSCMCSSGGIHGYEVFCPALGSHTFSLEIKPERQTVKMTCTNRQEPFFKNLEYLDELHVGAAKTFEMAQCSAPEDSFMDIMDKMGMSDVKVFRFKYSSSGVQPYHLLNMSDIRLLDFDGAQVTKISRDFFKEAQGVKYLLLSENPNLQVDEDSFYDLTDLERLDLSKCQLTSLPQGLFAGLQNLQTLVLKENRLKDLPASLFQDLKSLDTLCLDNNGFEQLQPGVFDNLANLTDISMGYSALTSLPELLFSQNQNLKSFSFTVNFRTCSWPGKCDNPALKIPGSVFRNATSLAQIKMLHVALEELPEGIFDGLASLTSVILQSATLESLPSGLFSSNKELEKVDFSGNYITTLDDRIFAGLSKLTVLRLRKNYITSLNDQHFKDLYKLEELNLSENMLSVVAPNAFSFNNKLRVIDLSQNNLTYDGRSPSMFHSQPFEDVQILNLSQNDISQLYSEITNTFLNLRQLDLSHNSFNEFFANYLCAQKHNNLEVNLSNNNILRVYLDDRYNDCANARPFSLTLNNNPITCDCKAADLWLALGRELHKGVGRVAAIKTSRALQCGPTSPNELVGKNLRSLSLRDLTCTIDSPAASCPTGCACEVNDYYERVTVDCTGAGLAAMPSRLPKVSFPNYHITLNLKANQIRNVTYDATVDGYNMVDELILTDNLVSSIDTSHLPTNLKSLHLDGNRLTAFDRPTAKFFEERKVSLKVGGNPFSCSCESKELMFLVKGRQLSLADADNVTLDCEPNNPLVLIEAEEAAFCRPPSAAWLIAVIVVVTFFLVIAILSMVWYRETIIIWVYSQKWSRALFTEELVDNDKLYDAFISYSHHDSKFVHEFLLEGLERNENPDYRYKCLIHDRDWVVGEEIMEQIVHSVHSSRRTVLVLSEDYVKSSWTNLEFTAAHKQALDDKIQRVIVIVLGELPDKETMNTHLQKYINLNTYLKSDDPWFWEKLRYALPRRGTRRGPRKNRKRHKSDKLDLIKAQAEMEMNMSRTPSPPTAADQSAPRFPTEAKPPTDPDQSAFKDLDQPAGVGFTAECQPPLDKGQPAVVLSAEAEISKELSEKVHVDRQKNGRTKVVFDQEFY